ncbi:MAG: HlyD family efflux transporter periplasmic adaptor subunit [Bacteroidetes bacterium]|nr:HlyD family efflux transporter periplasmic adaptor subunit [Bacteroidota bacterium]
MNANSNYINYYGFKEAFNNMKNLSLLYLSSILLLACNNTSTPVAEDVAQINPDKNSFELSDKALQTIGLVADVPKFSEITGEIDVNGMLDIPPDQNVSYSLPYSGKITQIPLINGMKIKKGKLLFEIENPVFLDMQEQFLRNKSDLETARLNYQRQAELAKDKINAQKDLEDAKNQLQQLEAAYESSKEKLELLNYNPATLTAENLSPKTRFYSDKDYWVKMVHVNMGTFVQSGNLIVELLDLSHLHLELKVFEKDLNKLYIGQKIQFRLQHEEQIRSASIYLIGKSIDAERTVQVHGHLDSDEGNLLPGIFIHASILIAGDSSWWLPSSALQVWQGKNYLFEQVGKNTFHMLEIKNPDIRNNKLLLDQEYRGRKFVNTGAFELLAFMQNANEEE